MRTQSLEEPLELGPSHVTPWTVLRSGKKSSIRSQSTRTEIVYMYRDVSANAATEAWSPRPLMFNTMRTMGPKRSSLKSTW